MMPSPLKVVKALVNDRALILSHLGTTLAEAAIGMGLSLIGAFLLAVLMDRFVLLNKAFYPVAIITQTVPTVAIAPLLVLWFGFGMAPKILLIFLSCFFPMLVALLTGLETADKNVLRLYRSMNASYLKVLFDVKLPYALDSFFSGLRISTTYAVVGAVVAEWLGGDKGLGVYMTRVRKSFAFDKMFAVIIVISALSLCLMKLVEMIQVKAMPWKKYEKK
jgi:ABC-type nitrate/sulfonate/bicarbonate transport system permease component